MACCFEVHNEKGTGFLEPVYQECLEIEFSHQNVQFEAHLPIAIEYRHRKLKQSFIPDFICYGKILLEIKAVEHLAPAHEAQVINYLKASGLTNGIMINLGAYPKLEYKRRALSRMV